MAALTRARSLPSICRKCAGLTNRLGLRSPQVSWRLFDIHLVHFLTELSWILQHLLWLTLEQKTCAFVATLMLSGSSYREINASTTSKYLTSQKRNHFLQNRSCSVAIRNNNWNYSGWHVNCACFNTGNFSQWMNQIGHSIWYPHPVFPYWGTLNFTPLQKSIILFTPLPQEWKIKVPMHFLLQNL